MDAIKPSSSPLHGLPVEVRRAIRAYAADQLLPHAAAVLLKAQLGSLEVWALRSPDSAWHGSQATTFDSLWREWVGSHTLKSHLLSNNRGHMAIQSYCWLHAEQLTLRYLLSDYKLHRRCPNQEVSLPWYARSPQQPQTPPYRVPCWSHQWKKPWPGGPPWLTTCPRHSSPHEDIHHHSP